jgi:hypothetical protein
MSRFLLCNSEIAIGLKIAAVEFRGELNAFVDPFGVIEGAVALIDRAAVVLLNRAILAGAASTRTGGWHPRLTLN